MNKKIILMFSLILGTVMFCGCAMFESKIPELNEDEKAVVVEYATESLLRYETKKGDRVKHVNEELFKKPEIIGEAPADEAPPSPTPEPETMTVVDNPDVVTDTDVIDNTGEGESSFSQINEAIGMADKIDINYTSYDVLDYYPEDISNYFVMNAQSGYKLLVLKFNVTNKTGSDLLLAMPYGDVRYKIVLNGNTKNALSTLLLNDMAAFKGNIAPGESTELVVVGEYPQSDLSSIDSIKLEVKAQNGDSTFTLK